MTPQAQGGRRDPNRGGMGEHNRSIWATVMAEGTPKERAELRRRMSEAKADHDAMEHWYRGGFTSGAVETPQDRVPGADA
jgi:hypothetical protein